MTVIIDHDTSNNVRIVGIICPIAWDKLGKVLDVIIAAEGEEEFSFCDSPKKQMLLSLSGFKIEIICSLDDSGQNNICDVEQITFFS